MINGVIQKRKFDKTQNMKRYLLIFAMLLGVVYSRGQSATDQAVVLQKCLDLPELQQYYPVAAGGIHQQVYIMQYPYVFPAGIQVSKFGKVVQIVDRSTVVDKQAVAYFLFQTFSIKGNKANVTFDFYYNYNTNKTFLNSTVVLNKNGDTWTVSDSKLIGR